MNTTNSRPILFSAPMVRALIDGTKTQTRRIVKPQPHEVISSHPPLIRLRESDPCLSTWKDACPYGQPGDQLWVRETCRITQPLHDGDTGCVEYRADYDDKLAQGIRWRPSIHMPRWASRLTLTITDIRVQRLQDITEQDTIDEGILPQRHDGKTYWTNYLPNQPVAAFIDPVESYRSLWDSINGPTAWDQNPYVWAITFTAANR